MQRGKSFGIVTRKVTEQVARNSAISGCISCAIDRVANPKLPDVCSLARSCEFPDANVTRRCRERMQRGSTLFFPRKLNRRGTSNENRRAPPPTRSVASLRRRRDSRDAEKCVYFDKGVSLIVHLFLEILPLALPFLSSRKRITVERYWNIFRDVFASRYAFRFAATNPTKIPWFAFILYTRDARNFASANKTRAPLKLKALLRNIIDGTGIVKYLLENYVEKSEESKCYNLDKFKVWRYGDARIALISIRDNFKQLMRRFLRIWNGEIFVRLTIRFVECAKLVSVADKRGGDPVETISKKYRDHGRFAPCSRKSKVLWKQSIGYSTSFIKTTRICCAHFVKRDLRY